MANMEENTIKLLSWDRLNMVAIISINDSVQQYTVNISQQNNTSELVIEAIRNSASAILDGEQAIIDRIEANPDMTNYINDYL